MKTKTLCRSLCGAASAGAALLTVGSAQGQNLFVTSYATGNVYEFTPGGAQSTFATGLNFPAGIAFNSVGDLFVGSTANNAGESGYITEYTPGGAPTTFYSGVDPAALAFNSAGDLFEADYRSGKIYEYTPGGVASTFASGVVEPNGLAFQPVPEPSVLGLIVAGAGGFLAWRRASKPVQKC